MFPWAPLALISTTVALLGLPVTPALVELLKRTDAAPLPTTRHDARITNFAEQFRSRMEPFLPELELCCASGETRRVRNDGLEALLIGTEVSKGDFDFSSELLRGVAAIVCREAALIPPATNIQADVYAGGPVRVGENSAIRAALGISDITLEPNSMALRWLHADGNAMLRQGSAVYGRLSAGECIYLERGCGFERIHAPHIFTRENSDSGSGCSLGDVDPDPSVPYPSEMLTFGPRSRVHGDFFLPPGETLNANVIVTGTLRFGEGSRFFGSAKSYKDTIIEPNASIYGCIVCSGNLHVGRSTFLGGPVMVEGDVVMGQGVRVGTPHALTTVSCQGARIAPGCHLHGTVWARSRGIIED